MQRSADMWCHRLRGLAEDLWFDGPDDEIGMRQGWRQAEGVRQGLDAELRLQSRARGLEGLDDGELLGADALLQ